MGWGDGVDFEGDLRGEGGGGKEGVVGNGYGKGISEE